MPVYKVDTVVTYRVTIQVNRVEYAKTEEEAIEPAKRSYGEGLERHLRAYQNCEDMTISMTWEASKK